MIKCSTPIIKLNSSHSRSQRRSLRNIVATVRKRVNEEERTGTGFGIPVSTGAGGGSGVATLIGSSLGLECKTSIGSCSTGFTVGLVFPCPIGDVVVGLGIGC